MDQSQINLGNSDLEIQAVSTNHIMLDGIIYEFKKTD